jgi:hypothetical protein
VVVVAPADERADDPGGVLAAAHADGDLVGVVAGLGAFGLVDLDAAFGGHGLSVDSVDRLLGAAV